MKAQKVFLFFCVILGCLLAVGGIWTELTEQDAHRSPDEPRRNLEQILEKQEQELTDGEYTLLESQTGLGIAGIRSLWQQGRQQELLFLQERLYAPVEITCGANTLISREERITSEQGDATFARAYPTVQPGDILISFNCHVGGWRSGHAALVVDTERGLSLEARVMGTDTALISLEHWLKNPSVAVLRVKGLADEQRQAVADYARTYLVDIPYRLLSGKAGVTGNKVVHRAEARRGAGEREPEAEITDVVLPEGTHCAHLVWSAYKAFGYDLDGDGGWIVTPRDIYDSELVEIVQQYGM